MPISITAGSQLAVFRAGVSLRVQYCTVCLRKQFDIIPPNIFSTSEISERRFRVRHINFYVDQFTLTANGLKLHRLMIDEPLECFQLRRSSEHIDYDLARMMKERVLDD
jgi:hypothetical protein